MHFHYDFHYVFSVRLEGMRGSAFLGLKSTRKTLPRKPRVLNSSYTK